MALKDSKNNGDIHMAPERDSMHLSFSSEQLNNALRIAGIVCVTILTLFILVHTISAVRLYPTLGETDAAAQIQNTISVSGQADMDVSPDVTVFSVLIDAEGKTIEDAQNKASVINNKAIAFLMKNGVAKADIKNTGLYTSPKYDTKYKPCPTSVVSPKVSSGMSPNVAAMYPTVIPPCESESVISGYTTNISFEVKVRKVNKDETKTSTLIAGLAPLGAKASSPMSTIDKPDVYKNMVRKQAIAKARADAEVLARDLGVKIVRVVNFSDMSATPYPMYSRSMMSKDAGMAEAVDPELPTGTNKISSQVTITYQIK